MPRPSNLGSGLLMPFGNQLPVLFEGVGVMVGLSAAHGPPTFDWLAKSPELDFILILYINSKTQLISASLLRPLSQPDVQTLSLT